MGASGNIVCNFWVTLNIDSEQGLKWDLAGGGTLKSSVAVQRGKMTHFKTTPKLICALASIFFVDRLCDLLLSTHFLTYFSGFHWSKGGPAKEKNISAETLLICSCICSGVIHLSSASACL